MRVGLLWFLFSLFVLGAIADLVSTWLPLRKIGWSFEGNPLGVGLWVVVLIKIIVCFLAWWACRDFIKGKGKAVHRFGLVSFLVILFLAQVFAAINNTLIYKKDVFGNDEFVKLEDGSVNIFKDGVLVDNLKPKVGMEKLVQYYGIVFLIALYPYFIGLFNFWLTKKIEDRPEV